MKRVIVTVLSCTTLMGLVACSTPDASTSEDVGEAAPELNSDNDDSIRENQVESDQRAREEREDMFGDSDSPDSDAVSSDASTLSGDEELAETVQAELDMLFPGNQLDVESEGGDVTVSGEATSEAELQQVGEIVAQIDGVRSVNLEATAAASSI